MRPIHINELMLAVVVATLCAPAALGELPNNLRTAIEKAVDEYSKSTKDANDKLSKAFDATVEQIRKSPQIKPESKQSLIEAVANEKLTFEKYGTLPFSVPMRQPANQYLTTIEKARTQAAKPYDRAIDHLQRKEKDDAAASNMTEEKKKVLAPRVIAHWECVGGNFRGNFTWQLKADGTISGANDRTWRFEGEKLILRIGAMVDTCRISMDGTTLKATNQYGGAYNGTLVAPQAGS